MKKKKINIKNTFQINLENKNGQKKKEKKERKD